MQNKYLIDTQNKHFSVKTFATAMDGDSADFRYEDLPMDQIRENIITSWLFLSRAKESDKQKFIRQLKLDELIEPQFCVSWMKVSQWFNEQTPTTQHQLWSFAQ